MQDAKLPPLPPAVQEEIRELFARDRSLKELTQKYRNSMQERDFVKTNQIDGKMKERCSQLIDTVVKKYEAQLVTVSEATAGLSDAETLELKARLDYLFLIVNALDDGIVEFNALLHRIGRREIITQFDAVQKACKPIKAQIQYCFKDSSDFYIECFEDTALKLYKVMYEKAVQMRKRITTHERKESSRKRV